ncbi:MAG: DUF2752 domain-containing protein [Acidobacteriota bacterium]|nr:DUF2752 domain-containing protein [Acidobacteriota bacterium]
MPPLATRRAAGEFRFSDGAVILSLVSLAILFTSIVLPAGGFPGIDACAFHALTGLSCPSCGLTRAFCAISHGQFGEAWSLHPFSFLFYALVLAGVGAPWLNRRCPALTGRAAALAWRGFVLVLAAAMLAYGGWRAKGEFAASRAGSHARTLPVVDR